MILVIASIMMMMNLLRGSCWLFHTVVGEDNWSKAGWPEPLQYCKMQIENGAGDEEEEDDNDGDGDTMRGPPICGMDTHGMCHRCPK